MKAKTALVSTMLVLALALLALALTLQGLTLKSMEARLQDAHLAEYRYRAAWGMGSLTYSQCFWPSDGCLEFAESMVRYVPEDGSAEAYLEHLAKDLTILVESECVDQDRHCQQFACSVVYPVEQGYDYLLPPQRR